MTWANVRRPSSGTAPAEALVYATLWFVGGALGHPRTGEAWGPQPSAGLASGKSSDGVNQREWYVITHDRPTAAPVGEGRSGIVRQGDAAYWDARG